MEIRKKQTTASPPGDDPMEFVMSDDSVDRMGDVIEQDGWQLDNFRKNPICLFGHDPAFPVGRWRDVGVHKEQLIGRLELMEPVSERLREIHAAVNAGVLRAVSVGFHSRKDEPLKGSKNGGLHFLETELVECSLVSVGANPNALAKVKNLGISREGQQLIIGVSAESKSDVAATRSNGVSAGNESFRKSQPMLNLSDRIQASQTAVNQLRDDLRAHLQQAGDNLDEPVLARSDELQTQIDAELRRLEGLRRYEAALGSSTVADGPTTTRALVPMSAALPPLPMARPFAIPKREPAPGELLLNAIKVHGRARHTKEATDRILSEWGWADNVGVRACLEWVQRAASSPGTTTTTGWAAELVQTQYSDLLSMLLVKSIYQPLSALGVRYDLGRAGQIQIPVESATPTVAGSFVAEGAPIPVRQEAFTPITIGLKKMAVISTFTRELFEHSQPNIDTQLRDRMGRDTSVAIDTILLDNNAVSSTRPAGLRNGVSGLTPTAGGGFNALVTDLKALLGVLVAANSLRSPVWVMNPQQALSIQLAQSSAGVGVFPFADQIEAGRLLGYPVLTSSVVTATMVILLDAADFATLSGDDARFELSDQATLHFEDTNPLQIATGAQGSGVLATPTRSLWQTDSIGLRMIMPMNWIMRRTGLVAWVTGVTW